jgi:uncharacterized metal-binding protein
MINPGKVNIVPCSGIGKSFGSVSRLAAYLVTEDDRPNATNLVPLALLVLGDKASNETIKDNPSITLDGCKLQCAKTMVEQCRGRIVKDFVVLDTFREHRDLKPEGISKLNEAGEALARELADDVNELVDQKVERKEGKLNA